MKHVCREWSWYAIHFAGDRVDKSGEETLGSAACICGRADVLQVHPRTGHEGPQGE
jgi:hypothetical protein